MKGNRSGKQKADRDLERQQERQIDTWEDNGHSEEHHHMAARVRQLV